MKDPAGDEGKDAMKILETRKKKKEIGLLNIHEVRLVDANRDCNLLFLMTWLLALLYQFSTVSYLTLKGMTTVCTFF